MVNDETFLNQITALLRKSGAFPGVDDNCLRSIAEATTWFSVRGGNTLFSQGDPSDALYITVSGLLAANVRQSSGEEITVGRIRPGEVIGEMGCVTGESRSATIRALRTSELLAVSREALDQLAHKHPSILLSLYRTVVGRLRSVQEGKSPRYSPRTFCRAPSMRTMRMLSHTIRREARCARLDLPCHQAALRRRHCCPIHAHWRSPMNMWSMRRNAAIRRGHDYA